MIKYKILSKAIKNNKEKQIKEQIKEQINNENLIIITGASDNHYLSLINMIDSFILHNTNNNLIVYNLGLNENNWKSIQNKYKDNKYITYEIFDYSKYPFWFDINIEAGQYAWKPVIIYNEYIKFPNKILIWMDAGNLIDDDLTKLKESLIINGIHTGVTVDNIKTWTHPKTIEYMKCNYTHKQNRNAACIGVNTKINFVKDFLTEFYNCSLTKDCIAPEGSDRTNHRQDQAVLTILYYKYIFKYKFENYVNKYIKYFIGYSIHNDV